MEKNIIYNSHKVNILELVYNILLKYDIKKENVIVFDIDWDDLNYSSTFNLDSNLNFTQSLKEEFFYDDFNVGLDDTKNFDIDIYIKNKCNILKNILMKCFSIKISGELPKEVSLGNYIEDELGDEIEIEKRLEKYYFQITCDINSLKTKFIEYLNNEINSKNFYYGNGIIEESILSEFLKRGKDKIKISSKDLGDKLKTDSTNFYKCGNKQDLITIVFYNDVIELFLYKLYLDGKLEGIEINRNGTYEIKKSIINSNNNKVIIDYSNMLRIGNNTYYYKDNYIIYNNETPYKLKKTYEHTLLKVLLDNIGETLRYDEIEQQMKKYGKEIKSGKTTIAEKIDSYFENINREDRELNFMKDIIQKKSIPKY